MSATSSYHIARVSATALVDRFASGLAAVVERHAHDEARAAVLHALGASGVAAAPTPQPPSGS